MEQAHEGLSLAVTLVLPCESFLHRPSAAACVGDGLRAVHVAVAKGRRDLVTASEIVTALRSRAITDLRSRKLRALCDRMKVSYEAVLDLLTETERKALSDPSLR
jgi:hypothetical protein